MSQRGFYIGKFKDDKKHGQGILLLKGKFLYQGSFENNGPQSNGEGKKIWLDGRSYKGKFTARRPQGPGTLIFPNRDILTYTVKGVYKNKKIRNSGTMNYAGPS